MDFNFPLHFYKRGQKPCDCIAFFVEDIKKKLPCWVYLMIAYENITSVASEIKVKVINKIQK